MLFGAHVESAWCWHLFLPVLPSSQKYFYTM